MRHSLLPLLLALSLPLAAQYRGEGPGLVTTPAPEPLFGPTALGNGVTAVKQLQLTPHASLGAGVYYLACTVVRSGGAGGDDVMTGIYNTNNNTFTKNNDVDHLNTSGSEFQCSVSDDLLAVTLDTPTSHPVGAGRAIFATRTSTTMPFGAAQRVNLIPTAYVDPQFTRVNGRLMFMWAQIGFSCSNNTAIAIGEFDLQTGNVNNQRVLVSNPGPRSTGSHSPSGMFDANGEMRAVIFSCCVTGRQSNAFFCSSIDDVAPAFELEDGTSWTNNPDANGGSLLYAESPPYTNPLSIQVVAMNSAIIPSTGGNLNITLFAPTRRPPVTPQIGFVLVGVLGTGPISVPGISGSPLSLNPATMFAVQIGVFDPVNGTTAASLPMPPLPPNITANAQAAMLDAMAGRLVLGNTAWWQVR